MRAIIRDRYGPPEVLRLDEVAAPEPREGEVRVRVRASSLNAGDWHLMRADPFVIRFIFGGLFRPTVRVLGADVAGCVERIGPGVTRLRPGDPVFADVSGVGFGAFAEYVCVPESVLAPMPANLSFREAAAIPSAATAALQALRDKGRLRPGQRVLVIGASGGVGSYAVQIARAVGGHVTGVAGGEKVGMVRGLGAHRVIDRHREDFTENGAAYDLIADAGGFTPFSGIARILARGGTYVYIGGTTAGYFGAMLLGGWRGRRHGVTVRAAETKPSVHDVRAIGDLVESGKLRPVIDRVFPLEAVPDAIRYLESGAARGKVVISVH